MIFFGLRVAKHTPDPQMSTGSSCQIHPTLLSMVLKMKKKNINAYCLTPYTVPHPQCLVSNAYSPSSHPLPISVRARCTFLCIYRPGGEGVGGVINNFIFMLMASKTNLFRKGVVSDPIGQWPVIPLGCGQ